MSAKSHGWAIALIALVLGMAGGTLAAVLMLKAPLQRLSLMTPVFVLDRARLIQALPPNATAAQMANTVDNWKQLAAKLSAAGYLVIDASAVIAAPEDVYVRTEGR